jgi:hypothetical protein
METEMAVMDNEDPALPEVSDDEAWYDAEIAPALAALAKRCHERGMSFIAAVEYQPGDRGGTYYLTENAGTAMRMLHLCAQTAPNVDGYIMSLHKWAKAAGVDTGGSFVMRRLGA